jgi:hypothetical protein
MSAQSYLLHFVSIYELTFPFFVMTWCIVLFVFRQSLPLLLNAFGISVVITAIRAIILSWVLVKNYIVWGFIYYILYFSVLLPLKIFAFVTVLNNSWVTPARHRLFSCVPACSWDAQAAVICIVLWNIFVTWSIVGIIWQNYAS